jgi:hypothetical protein
LRAAYRYPMHFTELSTLSGTETVTGNAGLSIPFSHIYGSTDSRIGTLSTSVSQSPTFNVAVLETQEFYKGMLAQLTVDQLNNYLAEGIPHEVIFMLAFSGFRFQPSPDEAPLRVTNNFHLIGDKSPEGVAKVCQKTNIYESECFHDILRALEDRHLTIEAAKDASNVGAPLDVKRLDNLKDLQLINAGGLQITAFDLGDCEAGGSACSDGKGFDADTQKRILAGETFYRIQKVAKESRFCFDVPVNEKDGSGSHPVPEPNPVQYDEGTIAYRAQHGVIPAALICANRIKPKDRPSHEELVRLGKCSTAFMGASEKKHFVPPKDCPLNFSADSAMTADTARNISAYSLGGAEAGRHAPTLNDFPSVEMRSTEGVIYYLGEIARCEVTEKTTCPTPKARIDDLNLADKPLFCVLKNGVTTDACRDASSACQDAGSANANRMALSFEGAKYEVPMDPAGCDRSGQVLRVVTQLVALNRAAKDFPVPAVIPLISH